MTETDETQRDPKQQAMLALTLAMELFWRVTLDELEARFPGRAKQNQELLGAGKAHIAVAIQTDGAQLRASLAFVAPAWVEALAEAEMRLHGPIEAAFADPDKLKIVDLGKLN